MDAGTDGGAPDTGSAVDGGQDAGVMSCLSGTACGLFPSSGCGAGETCAYAFTTSRTNECVTPGTSGLGEGCAANSECSRGLSCLNGFCVELCCPTATADTCGTGTACTGVNVGIGGMTDDIGLCTCTVGGAACPADHYCDPLAGDPAPGAPGTCLAQGSCNRLTQDCPAGEGCYGTVRECVTAGTAADGEACTVHSDCLPGHWCLPGAAANVCTSYCEVGGTTPCAAGFECRSFGDDEPQVGGCYPI